MPTVAHEPQAKTRVWEYHRNPNAPPGRDGGRERERFLDWPLTAEPVVSEVDLDDDLELRQLHRNRPCKQGTVSHGARGK